ncbi:hypothetical protein H6F67_13360 [Microcoleus sp. FACHB-1515]|uniref:hypothetical protein n=1 Tax=Cyanophyceae TaxID=3028117 RepID=UPI001681DFB4|nr:hypothetical protein [Microcoleus sp. FACHB-1515]MBD2090838.1 hypothetical protein [Microcoleus sp. FACHB-1515]
MKSVLVLTRAEAWQQTAIEALRQAVEADGGSIATAVPADLICPLTFNLPDVEFPGQAVFQACCDFDGMRDRVRKFDYGIGSGSHWLPIVHTAKGTLYGEVITTVADAYQQPLHLSDRLRQPLYALGQILMRELAAPPSVYLLQFGLADHAVVFDRLWPFPAAPAIASIGVQLPNLYECHWKCLSHQAIVDLAIAGSADYKTVS